jgi:hypothetical protein
MKRLTQHNFIKRSITALSLLVFTAAVRIAHAQTPAPSAGKGWHSFRDLTNSLGSYVSKSIFPILVTLAVLAFMYNIALFMINSDNEKEREIFKKYSVNAVIALTILLCVWGVVGIFTQTIFHSTVFIPQFRTSD